MSNIFPNQKNLNIIERILLEKLKTKMDLYCSTDNHPQTENVSTITD